LQHPIHSPHALHRRVVQLVQPLLNEPTNAHLRSHLEWQVKSYSVRVLLLWFV
jgi:hypothetical protein